MRRLLAVGLLVALAGCGGNPTAPSPHMFIIQPYKGNTLKIGDVVAIQWSCINCETVRAREATVHLLVQSSSGVFSDLGEIGHGLLSDTISWKVNRLSGVYYIHVYSWPPPSQNTWTESSSGMGDLPIKIEW